MTTRHVVYSSFYSYSPQLTFTSFVQMSVFKQNPTRRESHRRRERANTPRLANPHAALNANATPYAEYSTPSGASSGHISSGSTSPYPWQVPSVSSSHTASSASNIPSSPPFYSDYEQAFPFVSPTPMSLHGASSSSLYPNPSSTASSALPPSTVDTMPHLVVQLFKNDRTKKLELSTNGFALPTFSCACHAQVRVLYLPAYAMSPLDVGVLWNFSNGESSMWMENSMSRGDNLLSCVKCPFCIDSATNIGLFLF